MTINRIRKAGIAFLGAFIIGGDEEDSSIFFPTLQFIQSSHIDVPQISKLTPLPGTRLWKTLNVEKRMLEQNFPQAWDDYRLTRILFQPAKMSIEDINEGNAYLKTNLYSLWETVKRAFSTLTTTKSLTATAIAYNFNRSFRKVFLDSDKFNLYNHPDIKTKFNR